MLVVALCAACSSDAAAPAPPELPNGSMQAQIDGAPWYATLGLSVSQAGATLVIGGTDGAGTSILLAVVPDTGRSEYVIGAAATTAALVTGATAATWQAQGGAGSGSITFSALTATRVAGTFSFTAPFVDGTGAAGTKRVTRGVFAIDY